MERRAQRNPGGVDSRSGEEEASPQITRYLTGRGGADGATGTEALQIIEISDKDYRSLHLPCDALEECSDRKPGR